LRQWKGRIYKYKVNECEKWRRREVRRADVVKLLMGPHSNDDADYPGAELRLRSAGPALARSTAGGRSMGGEI
jgi:hypothetical protein